MWGRAKLASQLAYPPSCARGGETKYAKKGRTMRFKKASALFIALAVVGVACGDDSNDSSGATAAPAGSAAPGATTAPDGTAAPAAGGSLVIASDLPLQGA